MADGAALTRRPPVGGLASRPADIDDAAFCWALWERLFSPDYLFLYIPFDP
jgi:hypothetical protein